MRSAVRARCAFALGVLLVLNACDSSHPSAAPSSAAIVPPSSPSGDPSATSAPLPSATTEQLPEKPTVVDGIQAAVRAGTISPAIGYLYRFYAQWGDARLPEAYRGQPVEDDELEAAATADLSSFSAEEQATLQPFLARPSQPGSYWSSDDVGASEATGHVALARVVTTATCTNAWSRLDMSIPVTIWGRCRAAANGQPTVPITSSMTKVAAFMTNLWPRMTGLMGTPIGDAFAGAAQAPTEPIEAGDGRLDIYIVEAPNVSYLRDVENDALAVTRSAAPYKDGTSSAYMIVDPTKAASDAIFKSNVAHEFFHVLGDIYNSTGKYFCPYPSVTATCAGDRKSHWISEASATWAEHHFVPEARVTEIYEARWQPFDQTWQSLSDNRWTNNYSSFTWPMFMEQESATKEKIIRTTWEALKGKSTWADLQAAVDGTFPFKDHFRDFAVRVWNEKLDPGDPIVPRFQKLDPTFPTNRPDEIEEGQRFAEAVALPLSQSVYRFSPAIRELWATYYDISPSSDTHKLTLDFGGLTPNGNLDVDALVRVRDVGWERRKLTSGINEWCLDKPEDAIEEVILVLSNHSTKIEDWVRGDWTAAPSSAGCGTATNTIVFKQTLTSGTPGDAYYAKEVQNLTVNLKLKANDFTGPNGNDFLNDGSGYTVSVDGEVTVQTVDPACPLLSIRHGGGGGAAPDEDSFVASAYQDPDSIGNPSAPPGGRWLLSVSGSVRVDVTTTESSCIGTGSSTAEVVVQLPFCEGEEASGGGPSSATRQFNLNCVYNGDGLSWSLIGSVSVNR